jgi:hypothetical protein
MSDLSLSGAQLLSVIHIERGQSLMLSIFYIVKGWYMFIINGDILTKLGEELLIYLLTGIVGMACLIILYAIIGGIYLGAVWLLS